MDSLIGNRALAAGALAASYLDHNCGEACGALSGHRRLASGALNETNSQVRQGAISQGLLVDKGLTDRGNSIRQPIQGTVSSANRARDSASGAGAQGHSSGAELLARHNSTHRRGAPSSGTYRPDGHSNRGPTTLHLLGCSPPSAGPLATQLPEVFACSSSLPFLVGRAP